MQVYLPTCAFVNIADMFNRWWIGLDDVGKNVAATSFVISRIGNDVDRMLMHHILERERESQTDRQTERRRATERELHIDH